MAHCTCVHSVHVVVGWLKLTVPVLSSLSHSLVVSIESDDLELSLMCSIPPIRGKQERMREARRQMEEEVEERRRNVENALKDPKKAEIYRKLREVMPDTPINIK